jgi:hypothetical protein
MTGFRGTKQRLPVIRATHDAPGRVEMLPWSALHVRERKPRRRCFLFLFLFCGGDVSGPAVHAATHDTGHKALCPVSAT